MRDWRVIGGVSVAVLAIWLVGAAITKYSLSQMAFLAPVAVLVLGSTVAIVLLWAKVISQTIRSRRAR